MGAAPARTCVTLAQMYRARVARQPWQPGPPSPPSFVLTTPTAMRLLLGSLLGILVPTLVSPLAEPLLSRAGTVKLPFTSKEEQLRLLREWIDQVDPELAHYPPQYFVNPASIVVSDRVADDLRRLDDGTFDESRQHLGRSLLDANETCEIDLSLSKTAGLANDEEISLTITNNCTDGPNAPSTSHWIGLYPNAAANISEVLEPN